MFEVVHEVPGRLRLRSRRLWRNPALGAAVADRLRAMPGVRAAEASPRTGSLLIHHDGAPGRAEALRAEFAAAPLPMPRTPALPAPAIEAAFDRLATALVERMAQHLAGAVAAALI